MIEDPLAVFLDDFSEDDEIVFEWDGGGMQTLKGIFDDAFTDAATGETILDTTRPRITTTEANAIIIPREAVTTIRGKVYSVVQVQPDGTGFATIELTQEE